MRREAPAVARNSEPLAEVLGHILPARASVLEVASGTGEHAVFMARRFPGWTWQPTDPDPDALSSIEGWRDHAGLTNVMPGLLLDASADAWPISSADAVVCINMIHISPWEACEGLFAGSARLLAQGAPLVLYGPFLEEEVETAPSNQAFDESLRSRDPRWGIRRREMVDELAQDCGFTPAERYEMPANNLTLVYRRR